MFYAKGFTPLEKIILVRKNSLTGFTLIEVMVVVIIIGILASIALPLYSKAVERARITEALRTLVAIGDAEKQYAVEHGHYTLYIDQLGIGNNISQGKYFFYGYMGIFPGINPDPYNNMDDFLVGAARRNLSSGVYTGAIPIPGVPLDVPYVIVMNESGALISNHPEVNKLF